MGMNDRYNSCIWKIDCDYIFDSLKLLCGAGDVRIERPSAYHAGGKRGHYPTGGGHFPVAANDIQQRRAGDVKSDSTFFGKHGSLGKYAAGRSWRERSMSVRFAWCVTALVFAVVLLSGETVFRLREAEQASQRHAAALAFASELRARVERELNPALYLGSGIVGYLVARHDRIDALDVERILQEVYGFGRHVRNLAIGLGYRIAYIYPLEGNEGALNQDYRENAEQWPAVKKAIESGQGVLTGPVRLMQGGTALIYRIPVRAEGRYLGLVSTVIDMRSFERAVLGDLEPGRFEFAIRGNELAGPAGGLLFGRAELFADPSSVRVEAAMPSGKWDYAVRAAGRPDKASAWGLRVAGWLLAALAAAGVHTVLRQRSELARHAGLDSLTGLPNRRLFDDRLAQAIRRKARGGAAQMAIVFLDLDGFKRINDRHGHKFGDAVLSKVAARIRDEVRIGDTVARWAGDEFAVIIDEAGEARVGQLIQRLRRRIARPFEVDGVTLGVTASIGTAFYPGEAKTAAGLLELADQRMFAEKQRAGRA